MYWLCFSPCFVHKRNNYHSWIFSLVSNSGCGVIDSNFDLQPISQSGLIIFSHYPVLFSAEIGFCIVGCSFHMVLMCTCTWITAETFQTWRDKGGDFAAGASPGAAPLCVHVAESSSAPRGSGCKLHFILAAGCPAPAWSSLLLLLASLAEQ